MTASPPHVRPEVALPGASEVATVLGLGRTRPSDDTEPYTSQLELWARLTGALPRYDADPPSPDAELGKWFEIAVLNRLATERQWVWGRDIFPGPTLEQPGMAAHGIPWRVRPDAVVTMPAPVEAKCPRIIDPVEWTDDAPPVWYLVQCLAQIAVLHATHGAEVGFLAAMSRAPNSYAPATWRVYTIRRDADRERRMVATVHRWVEEHVVTGYPPVPDGSESAGRALRRMWAPVDDRVYTATPTDLERYHRWLQSRDALDEIKGHAEELRQHLQLSMGAATLMVGANNERLVTWRSRKDGVRQFLPVKSRRNHQPHRGEE